MCSISESSFQDLAFFVSKNSLVSEIPKNSICQENWREYNSREISII